MSKEIVLKLMDWVSAKLDEYNARDTSDGGLSESLRVMNIEEELRILMKDED